ncbi:aminotransferase class-III [Treponema primitia ZAS-2]|uniref:Aminotransferase class-III n=1 Tax=Treponema primitia (strain ATCC BAA-887 / DSM 12427 / ZAS-2) TaxID=545694 RepID=F5YJR5_TREPZ|nr:hemolysin family protein [Treponema primitia]AEF85272.1 aminotransferase class-III [Treponema primitia ZAS-2]
MDLDSLGIILTLGVLLCFSAFFSASETAFSSLNRIKLKNLANQGNKRAALALKLAENYDKLLSSVLIGNNIVNIASSALGTVLFVGLLGRAGVPISTLVLTILVLLFGEISPKTMAKEAPESFAMFCAPLLQFFVFLFRPLNRFFSLWKALIIKLFHIKTDRTVTEAELLTFVEEVRQEGGINAQEEDMIRRTIEFDDLTAAEIVTPRVDLAAVDIQDTPERIEAKFYETGFSRLPVYRGSIDSITGVILQKDFHYGVLKQGKSLESIMKPAVFVVKSIKISRLLKTLQEKKSQMAILVDEFGGTVGIVTIEDILEELVGEIWDEHDQVVEAITALGGGAYRVLGNTALQDVLDLYAIGEDQGTNATTVGSWVIETLGGVPKEGESFSFRNLSVQVTKALRHRVLEVVVRGSDIDLILYSK